MFFENEFSAIVFNVISNRLKASISPVERLAFGKILAYAGLKEGQFFERPLGPNQPNQTQNDHS